MNWLRKILGRSEAEAQKPPYYDPAKFKSGSTVRVGSRAQLEEFLRTWQYHHNLQPEQLPCAGRVAKVKSSGMYHGGDVVYQLENVPGIWHEQLLEPAQREDA
jgi:hypothetical protein